nr:MAG TPA: hypothetical protein [Bacteriophage sp.]
METSLYSIPIIYPDSIQGYITQIQVKILCREIYLEKNLLISHFL